MSTNKFSSLLSIMTKLRLARISNDQIIASHAGIELYFDKRDKILYSTAKGIARWLGCHVTTVTRKGVTLNAGRPPESLGITGLKGVTLFTSKEVKEIAKVIRDGKRTKPETKKNASDRLDQLAVVGYELSGMLAVAPEELAKLAINYIADEEQLAEVDSRVKQKAQYLKSYHGLHDELKAHGAEDVHHATVNKFNNEQAKVPHGKRPQMTRQQELHLMLMQGAEELAIMGKETNDAWHAVNTCKQAGKEITKHVEKYLPRN